MQHVEIKAKNGIAAIMQFKVVPSLSNSRADYNFCPFNQIWLCQKTTIPRTAEAMKVSQLTPSDVQN